MSEKKVVKVKKTTIKRKPTVTTQEVVAEPPASVVKLASPILAPQTPEYKPVSAKCPK